MNNTTLGIIFVQLIIHAGSSGAESAILKLPDDWVVEKADIDLTVTHQRARKLATNGDPLMYIELTQARLTRGDHPDPKLLLEEMRKQAQLSLSVEGWQGECSPPKEGSLGKLRSFETTCVIAGRPSKGFTQTWVAAVANKFAYTLSYAGPTNGYATIAPQIKLIRDAEYFPDLKSYNGG